MKKHKKQVANDTTLIDIAEVVQWFKDNKYEVEKSDYEEDFFVFKGNGIRACIGGRSTWYPTARNRIAMDNNKAFDKWSRVPVSLRLPVSVERLKNAIKVCGSKEGHRMSCSFDKIDFDPYTFYEGV